VIADRFSVRFAGFGIAEILLIDLRLLLKPMANQGMLIESPRFTKIDGEPKPLTNHMW